MLLASGKVRICSTQALRYASTLASAGEAVITLPNGKSLEVPDSDITFHMPAEWAPHKCTWLAWPKRYDVWRNGAIPAKEAYTNVILAIARFEPVTVVAHRDQVSLPMQLQLTRLANWWQPVHYVLRQQLWFDLSWQQ